MGRDSIRKLCITTNIKIVVGERSIGDLFTFEGTTTDVCTMFRNFPTLGSMSSDESKGKLGEWNGIYPGWVGGGWGGKIFVMSRSDTC